MKEMLHFLPKQLFRKKGISFEVKPAFAQIEILRQAFPEVDFGDWNTSYGFHDQKVDGWFALPQWKQIAPTYLDAVQKVFAALSKIGGKKFVCKESFDDGGAFHCSVKTERLFSKLSRAQGHGKMMVIVPVQFRSSEQALAHEFGLCVFQLAIILLTHHELFPVGKKVCAAGVRYSWGMSGATSMHSIFHITQKTISFTLESKLHAEQWFYPRGIDTPN